MSEDAKDNVATEPADDPLAGISRDDLKGHAMVQGMMTQLKQAQDKIAEIEAEREKAELDRKRTAAEAKGDYESALAEIKAASEAEVAKYKAEIETARLAALDSQLSAEIAKLGVGGNAVVEAGLKSLFHGQKEVADPAEWAKSFAESDDYKALANQKIVQPTPRPASQNGRAGAGDLAARLSDSDPSVLAAARAELASLRGSRPDEYRRILDESIRIARQ